MSYVVIDDYLLRDLLARRPGRRLRDLLARNRPATTNLYYFRLCRSITSSSGGQLTGSWPADRRRALGQMLVVLPAEIAIVPMRLLASDMAEQATIHRLSTLGAEAVTAARHLDAALYVWSGDDGPGIRSAAEELGVPYRTLDI